MGLIAKMFGKSDSKTTGLDATDNSTCPHTTMTPRWDSVDDIGKHDRATGFRCEGCGQMFSPKDAAMLRSDEASRLQATMS